MYSIFEVPPLEYGQVLFVSVIVHNPYDVVVSYKLTHGNLKEANLDEQYLASLGVTDEANDEKLTSETADLPPNWNQNRDSNASMHGAIMQSRDLRDIVNVLVKRRHLSSVPSKHPHFTRVNTPNTPPSSVVLWPHETMEIGTIAFIPPNNEVMNLNMSMVITNNYTGFHRIDCGFKSGAASLQVSEVSVRNIGEPELEPLSSPSEITARVIPQTVTEGAYSSPSSSDQRITIESASRSFALNLSLVNTGIVSSTVDRILFNGRKALCGGESGSYVGVLPALQMFYLTGIPTTVELNSCDKFPLELRPGETKELQLTVSTDCTVKYDGAYLSFMSSFHRAVLMNAYISYTLDTEVINHCKHANFESDESYRTFGKAMSLILLVLLGFQLHQQVKSVSSIRATEDKQLDRSNRGPLQSPKKSNPSDTLQPARRNQENDVSIACRGRGGSDFSYLRKGINLSDVQSGIQLEEHTLFLHSVEMLKNSRINSYYGERDAPNVVVQEEAAQNDTKPSTEAAIAEEPPKETGVDELVESSATEITAAAAAEVEVDPPKKSKKAKKRDKAKANKDHAAAAAESSASTSNAHPSETVATTSSAHDETVVSTEAVLSAGHDAAASTDNLSTDMSVMDDTTTAPSDESTRTSIVPATSSKPSKKKKDNGAANAKKEKDDVDDGSGVGKGMSKDQAQPPGEDRMKDQDKASETSKIQMTAGTSSSGRSESVLEGKRTDPPEKPMPDLVRKLSRPVDISISPSRNLVIAPSLSDPIPVASPSVGDSNKAVVFTEPKPYSPRLGVPTMEPIHVSVSTDIAPAISSRMDAPPGLGSPSTPLVMSNLSRSVSKGMESMVASIVDTNSSDNLAALGSGSGSAGSGGGFFDIFGLKKNADPVYSPPLNPSGAPSLAKPTDMTTSPTTTNVAPPGFAGALGVYANPSSEGSLFSSSFFTDSSKSNSATAGRYGEFSTPPSNAIQSPAESPSHFQPSSLSLPLAVGSGGRDVDGTEKDDDGDFWADMLTMPLEDMDMKMEESLGGGARDSGGHWTPHNHFSPSDVSSTRSSTSSMSHHATPTSLDYKFNSSPMTASDVYGTSHGRQLPAYQYQPQSHSQQQQSMPRLRPLHMYGGDTAGGMTRSGGGGGSGFHDSYSHSRSTGGGGGGGSLSSLVNDWSGREIRSSGNASHGQLTYQQQTQQMQQYYRPPSSSTQQSAYSLPRSSASTSNSFNQHRPYPDNRHVPMSQEDFLRQPKHGHETPSEWPAEWSSGSDSRGN